LAALPPGRDDGGQALAGLCPGRKPPFSVVKRGLVTVYNSK
jgi:hypothetical protein